MSKSLGNVLAVDNLLDIVRPQELRYYLGSAHYRSVLEYSEGALTEAAAGYRRIEEFLARFDNVELGQWTEGFEKAMNDDFSVPKALAEIHVAVREGNKALSASDEQTAQKLAESVRRMAEILGFDPLSNQWGAGESDDSAALEALDVLVQAERARRAQRSEEHTSELQSRGHLVCGLLLDKQKPTLYS